MISGRVLDTSGNPLSGVVVSAGGVAGQSVSRTLDAALVFGGTAYLAEVPVTWKLDKKEDSGQLSSTSHQKSGSWFVVRTTSHEPRSVNPNLTKI
jgi:hypothetical protein